MDHRLTALHGGVFFTRLAKYFQVDFGAVQFHLDSRTTPISFEVSKSKLKVLQMNDDGIWGVRGLPFPTINMLDMEGTGFHLPEARVARERRRFATEEEQVESVYEGGESPIPTLQPIHPQFNNARDY
ncbi:unnamed protein product [Linum trigynum]|uniref:Uncharacterized protein n=1 Tax=Linum trigynum TaxID=586398 RepID=A0AAV2G4W1_9ROSI